MKTVQVIAILLAIVACAFAVELEVEDARDSRHLLDRGYLGGYGNYRGLYNSGFSGLRGFGGYRNYDGLRGYGHHDGYRVGGLHGLNGLYGGFGRTRLY